ncbi:MAG: hypothetical protein CVV21_08615 [Candidatus Goldiibacteriota bacterium HGW-Goldbacteria-1]|jgi:energy-converting hydrogenase Eha subunit A|nr:MAG: hypothetical protein CVV21_08615 [Candidatus Goldiibacteriota bacterium HGW-Goldbacteria-1]
MLNNLSSYLLIKTFYEREKSLIDSFLPFVVYVIDNKKDNTMLFDEMTDKLKESFCLDVPINSLHTLLNRLKKLNLIGCSKFKEYFLTESGKEYAKKFSTADEEIRKINQLFDYLMIEFKKFGLERSKNEIEKILVRILSKQVEVMKKYFIKMNKTQHQTSIQERNEKIDVKETEVLINILERIYVNEPEQYEVLSSLIRGSILSVSLNAAEMNELGRKFEKITVYLDSNIMFSILNLHHDSYTKPALELFKMIKDIKDVEIKVFDFTITECVNVLHGYDYKEFNYITGIDIYSIYSALKNKGWSSMRVREFVIHIDDEIRKLGITIENTGITDIEKFQDYNKNDYAELKKRKEKRNLNKSLDEDEIKDVTPNSVKHDLAVIELIKKKRKGNVRNFEQAKYIFLTSDFTLFKFDNDIHKHFVNLTIAEVMFDKVFTNLLWLKIPKTIDLEAILSIFKNSLLIDEGVWEYFVELLVQEKNSGTITEEHMTELIYDQETRNLLINASITKNVDEINSKNLSVMVENLKKKQETNEAQQKKELNEVKQMFERKYSEQEQSFHNREQEQERRFDKKVNDLKSEFKNDIDNMVKKNSKKDIIIVSLILISVIIGFILDVIVGTKIGTGNTNVERLLSLNWINACIIGFPVIIAIGISFLISRKTTKELIDLASK